MKKILTFLTIMLLFTTKVSAASLCDYKEQSELNGKAANIKATYEIIEEKGEGEEGTYINYNININITNLIEDFYIIVKNDYTNEEKIYRNSDTLNNILTIRWDNIDKVTNFTIQIYSSNKTNCPDELYTTLFLTLPRYNRYSIKTDCIEYEKFYLCQKFVFVDYIKEEEFISQFAHYIKEDNQKNAEVTEKEEEKKFVNQIFQVIIDNKLIIICVVLIATSITITINVKKRKRQRELGLK